MDFKAVGLKTFDFPVKSNPSQAAQDPPPISGEVSVYGGNPGLSRTLG